MALDPFERRPVGKTGLAVTRLGLGGAPLGAPAVAGSVADRLIREALAAGVRYVDTAPLYGLGESERRFRAPLAAAARQDLVVSTKVGRILDGTERGWHFDYSANAIHASYDSSLARLGLDRVDILYIHDPDNHYDAAIGEAYRALATMRERGIIPAIGAGMNQWEMELRFAREGRFDVFLLAGRYTLLEQEPLREFFPYCAETGVAVVAGAPYNSGILASDLGPEATYNYRTAPPEVLERARRIKEVCDRHGVPLKAAALQFVLAHPVIVSAIPGARTAAEVAENIAMVRHPTPAALWQELKAGELIAEEAPVPA